MSTFLERLQVERDELVEKVEKLTNYINENEHFLSLSSANQNLLIKQHKHMLNYLQILDIRIELNSK